VNAPGYLLLEDGRTFPGEMIGAELVALGEAVFNTSMTGYQEVLTDPSYAGQIVTMTYPLIGNYGVNPDDAESGAVQVAGFVMREASRNHSNWRAGGSLQDAPPAQCGCHARGHRACGYRSGRAAAARPGASADGGA
jgi:carbamoyl-phosphate synthase small subunit